MFGLIFSPIGFCLAGQLVKKSQFCFHNKIYTHIIIFTYSYSYVILFHIYTLILTYGYSHTYTIKLILKHTLILLLAQPYLHYHTPIHNHTLNYIYGMNLTDQSISFCIFNFSSNTRKVIYFIVWHV